MKITLDVDKLHHEGAISRDEYERLCSLAEAATASVAFTILIGFGVIAVSGAALALVPVPTTAVSIGLGILVTGLALLITGIRAWRSSRRWILNTVAVFGGIHFYRQWFERLGASPETVMRAGLLALGFAPGLRSANLRLQGRRKLNGRDGNAQAVSLPSR